jgi:hypothetical protein
MIGIRPLVLWHDPEALLALLNCRYGVIRGQWDLQYQDTHASFNRAVLADPRMDPDYHAVRAWGLVNMEIVACLMGIGSAVLTHFVPSLKPLWVTFMLVMFVAMLLSFWRFLMWSMVLLKVRAPRWLMASSWALWAAFAPGFTLLVVTVLR